MQGTPSYKAIGPVKEDVTAEENDTPDSLGKCMGTAHFSECARRWNRMRAEILDE